MARRVGALLLLGLLALAGPARAESLEAQLEAARTHHASRSLAITLLDHLDETDAWGRRKLLGFGDWRLYPQGYGFQLPEGFETIAAPRGVDVLLIDTRASDALQRTIIAISVGGEDKNLVKNLTPERTRSAFGSSFQRFELLNADKRTPFGQGGVRLTYVSGASPQVLTHQYLFNKNGSLYTLTLTVENDAQTVADGLRRFEAFCDSFVFCGDVGGAAAEASCPYAFAWDG